MIYSYICHIFYNTAIKEREEAPNKYQSLRYLYADLRHFKENLSYHYDRYKKENRLKLSFPKMYPVDLLIISGTLNNQRAVQPLVKRGLDVSYVEITDVDSYGFSMRYNYSFLFSWVLFIYFIFSTASFRYRLLQFFEWFFLVPGYFVTAKKIIKGYNPKVILLSNDHMPFNRCMMYWAKRKKIKLIYVQHASVSQYFPPLDFDFSFLDGEESYQKYSIKSDGFVKNVIIGGAARFDLSKKINNISKKQAIGIALNSLDDITVVSLFITNLKQKLPNYQFIVRPHPRMNLSIDSFPDNIDMSDSKKEKPHTFFNRIDVLVACDSSIHFDAVSLGVPSYYYNFNQSNDILDYYSYIKNGLIKKIDKISEFAKEITENKLYICNNHILGYYNASYLGTSEYDINIIIKEIISNIIRNKSIDDILEKYFSKTLCQNNNIYRIERS